MTGPWLPTLAAVSAVVIGGLAAGAAERELRVCADPNNLPFSNEQGEGFENRIAELVADELDAELSYTWWAQRRGFIRNTLGAGACDLAGPEPVQVWWFRAPTARSTMPWSTRCRPARRGPS